MNETALTFMKDLLSKPTPSGYEQPGQKVVSEYMGRYADSVHTDVNGNVHGVLNPDAPFRVMLAGHCDEIGLMIMHIDDDGFLYFQCVGGINVPLLQGERVTVHAAKRDVPGVIGVRPIHLMEPKEREKGTSKAHELWIDIGAKSRKDAEKIVSPGDVATVSAGWTELRNGLVACRGFDDRAGAFVIADVLRLLSGKKLKVAVHAVSTTQEEIGLRGARTAAHAVNPDVGIAVDVTFATDTPKSDVKRVGEAKLGGGPVLHRGPNFNPRLYDIIRKAAATAKIKTQLQPIPRGSGTDANIIQMTRSGVASATISIATRYVHSPVEVLAIKDAENTAKLIARVIEGLKGAEKFTP
ncbi:MAG: M42 family metallopeptidase [Kiritimatiellia bacterium]|jgi:endoglucanase|nr:M42 family metallopeptidase [Kiritimatiellia bacterium]